MIWGFTFSFAQEKQKVSVEWIYSYEPLKIAAVPQFTWLSDGRLMLNDIRKPMRERAFEIMDPRSGARMPALDMPKAIESLRALYGGDELPPILPWPEEFDRRGIRGLYIFEKDIFVLELASASFRRLTQTEEEEKSAHFSPDGNKVAFVRKNDLFVYDLVTGNEKRITFDGSDIKLNGALTWLYWEEIFDRVDEGYWWSDDSKKIAYLHSDESEVSVMRWIDFKPAVPREILQRYPKAGGANPSVKVGVADIETAQTNWIDLEGQNGEYVVRVKWLPDNKRIAVQTLDRPQTELRLFFADAASGKPALILKETDSAWVNVQYDLHFLKDGKHFLWASERSGYNHLYRYTMDGKLVNAVTKGNWALRASGSSPVVNGINEKEGWVYVTALEKSSVEKHLYRVQLDGQKMQRLSQEDGNHRASFSPDGQYYVDNFSDGTTLPALYMRKNDGKTAHALALPRPELLNKFDIQYPKLFTIPTRDGFPMPASIMKPKDFDPNKKYPVIFFVYGGPSAPVVFNSWNRDIWYNQILLDNGFLVVKVDNRSATAISKTLENTVLKQQASDGELNDLVDAVQWMKKQSYVDADRVGIWGWSGGGTYTLLGMSRSKEFKAGIAVAALTDWSFYDTKYAETTMKTPDVNPDGYAKTNLNNYAKDLHGRLMIIHGTYDDNVHPQNAWNFADELIKANIRFDMMIYPMRKHGINDQPAQIHLYNTMIEFWKKNL
jgi:dipeptidyl-peptidase-4